MYEERITEMESNRTVPDRTDSRTREDGWKAFVRYLRQRGDRVTTARRIVFDRVVAREDHFRADDLAGELARGTDRVSRGTVYRTLALMEEAGFVAIVRDGDTHRHYESTFGRKAHDHMVCETCGAFLEFDDPRLEERIRENAERKEFCQRNHRLVVFGTCSDCSDEGCPDEGGPGARRGEAALA
jgi:Fur family ferric uptake transcriptional regulator